MKNMLLLFIVLTTIFGCKKQKCSATVPDSPYASDTTTAYQYVLGKWYHHVKWTPVPGPLQNDGDDEDIKCYSGNDDYINFLPDRSVYMHVTGYPIGTKSCYFISHNNDPLHPDGVFSSAYGFLDRDSSSCSLTIRYLSIEVTSFGDNHVDVFYRN